jgi:hypothetical protein
MKKIDIEDKLIISKFTKDYNIQASELSFTNLYAWREKYRFNYMILEGFLWLINIKNDTYYLSQPLGDYSNKQAFKKSVEQLKTFMGKRSIIIKKSDKTLIQTLKSLDYSFTYESIRNDYDYVYDFEKMKTLSGNKYHKKKNHVNQFKKKYDYHYEVLSESHFDNVRKICNEWFEDSDDEKYAIEDVLNHYNILDVTGGVLYVKDEPVGFIIGERLNEETLVIHFEKGVQGYHGIYQMIFYQYLQNLEGYTYINREQDLGITGLRKSKLSYHPVKFIEKYNVRFI